MTSLTPDCDDDGETAAGGRLAHLLTLLVGIYALMTGSGKRAGGSDAVVRRGVIGSRSI